VGRIKKLLNTLYVTTQGALLARERETVVVRVDREDIVQIPILTLESIVCFGHVMCTPPLMQLCCERGVCISFMSESGRFWARVEGPVSGNVLLRREQYRWADDAAKSAEIARSVVIAKIANCRIVLLRHLRDHPHAAGGPHVDAAVRYLGRVLDQLRSPQPLDAIRGHEGDAARAYFDVFDHLITTQKEDFAFRERSRRPPLDAVNALLSFLYALVTNDVAAGLESVGLDPAVGYLHRDRPGRLGLALDLVEELRPVLADRTALSLINRQQVRRGDFKVTEAGAVIMEDDTRKLVLSTYHKRKQEEIRHPFLGEQVSVGLLPFVQALLLGRHMRGDLDAYPSFAWR
jgi:CRISPR-associated protein Cas1